MKRARTAVAVVLALGTLAACTAKPKRSPNAVVIRISPNHTAQVGSFVVPIAQSAPLLRRAVEKSAGAPFIVEPTPGVLPRDTEDLVALVRAAGAAEVNVEPSR